MRLRTKLLILLLVIALVPLVAVSWFGQVTTRRLGEGIAARTHDVLVKLASARLKRICADQSRVLAAEGDRFELAVEFQARELERLLECEGEPGRRVWFAEDFDHATDLPSDAAASSRRHARSLADGTLEMLLLSQQAAAFRLPPGVAERELRPEIDRLSGVADAFRRARIGADDLFNWQFAALESGLHVSYPGHGGYPAGFDPRDRVWYQNALIEGGLVWNPPTVDASTGQVMLTVARPITAPDGSVAGVTGIDVRVVDLLRRFEAPEDLGAAAESMLVGRRPRDDGNGEELVVFAQTAYLASRAGWDAPIDIETIPLGSPPHRRMLADMKAGVAGVVRMPHRGRDCLWGYGLEGRRATHLLVVVPYESVVAEALDAEAQVLDETQDHLATTAVILVAVILMVTFVAYRGSRAVTRPVRRLSVAVRRLARGNFSTKAKITTGDELEDLANAFNDLAPKIMDQLRMRESLELAEQVQQSLLPALSPKLSGFDIAGRSVYCDETGGDYFDYLTLHEHGEDALGIAVGDVTGHGIAPALLMATARASLRSRAAGETGLAGLLSLVNRDLAADATAGRFMTLFYLVIDRRAERLRWVRAGHEPAMLYDPVSGDFTDFEGPDLPLGIEADWEFHELTRELPAIGEVLVIGTDGIWETRDDAGHAFGRDALKEVVRQNANRPASEICRAVYEAIGRFRGGRPQQDDITLVVIRRVREEGE